MTVVTIHKAKTELSKLIQRAVSGEDIVIAKGAIPMVSLTPVAGASGVVTNKKPRQPGLLKHLRGKIPDDIWFEPLPEEELKLWEGGE